MKKILAGAAIVFLFIAQAAGAERHDPNPTKDPDVQRGYDEHQKWYKEKQEREQRAKEHGGVDPYEVKKSHQGGEGSTK